MSYEDRVSNLLAASIDAKRNVSNVNEVEELFDTHPISMMLGSDMGLAHYQKLIKITNSWKTDWHKGGVQVLSCKRDNLKKAAFKKANLTPLKQKPDAFTLPSKLVHSIKDKNYDATKHSLVKKRYRLLRYNLDDLDLAWLSTVNEERECLGETLIREWMLEDVLESAEEICYKKIQKNNHSYISKDIEFDENTKCDICQSYEGEDGNELVFCDGCFVCVHQACYGVPSLPEGSWLCKRCELNAKSTTPCALCPNTGGAMKQVDDGCLWCHVSCALWVPEVGFDDIELMEPVIRLNDIPQARKNLVCSLCKLRYGAPIQCSLAKCKRAFHVTCAFQHNLIMRQEFENSDVRLFGLCSTHSSKECQSRLRSSSYTLDSQPDDVQNLSGSQLSPKTSGLQKHACLLSPAKKDSERNNRVSDIAAEFYKYVETNDIMALIERRKNYKSSKVKAKTTSSHAFDENNESTPRIPSDIVEIVLTYWRLKRRSKFNRPLIEISLDWVADYSSAMASEQKKQDYLNDVMHTFEAFKRIRFGLDRARLVVDMVLQREKRKYGIFRSLRNMHELVLQAITKTDTLKLLTPSDLIFFNEVCSGQSVYDNHDLLLRFSSTEFKHITDLSTHSTKLPKCVPADKPTKILQLSPPKAAQALNMGVISSPPFTYFVTGNPSVDSLQPEKLIIPKEVRKRLHYALTKQRPASISIQPTTVRLNNASNFVLSKDLINHVTENRCISRSSLNSTRNFATEVDSQSSRFCAQGKAIISPRKRVRLHAYREQSPPTNSKTLCLSDSSGSLSVISKC